MRQPSERRPTRIDASQLPEGFPTHRIPAEFWEALGRVVATFGFLEDVLSGAIFAFTATREYPDEDLSEVYAKWVPKLERALSDPLGPLIDAYAQAVREHRGATLANVDELVATLREAAVRRNVLCHGSWGVPDAEGRSLPRFFNRRLEKFAGPIDVDNLKQTQRHVVELICAVIDTVTTMGWRFPGARGPGPDIWPSGS